MNSEQPSVSEPNRPTDHQKFKVTKVGLILAISAILAVIILIFIPKIKEYRLKTGSSQTSAVVSISASGFMPDTVKIKQGQTVEWRNENDEPRQIASDPFPTEDGLKGFRQETSMTKGQVYKYTFNKKGTFTYHDHANPLKLKGTVIVE